MVGSARLGLRALPGPYYGHEQCLSARLQVQGITDDAAKLALVLDEVDPVSWKKFDAHDRCNACRVLTTVVPL